MTETSGYFESDEEDGLTEAAQAFLQAFSSRSWGLLGLRPDDAWFLWERSPGSPFLHTAEGWIAGDCGLTLFADVCAPTATHILRTLRIEWDGEGVRMGKDETGQGGYPLDPSPPGVVTIPRAHHSPSELGNLAADWLEKELRRPIEQHEWRRQSFTHRRFCLADTGEGLSWSDSHNQPRADLGPPDAVFVLRDFRGAR